MLSSTTFTLQQQTPTYSFPLLQAEVVVENETDFGVNVQPNDTKKATSHQRDSKKSEKSVSIYV